MPDNVDDLLAGVARAVGEKVRPPAGRVVRTRAARRVGRQRLTASVLAVSLAGLTVGAIAVISPHLGSRPAGMTTVTSVSAPSAPPSSPPAPATSPTSASPSASAPTTPASSAPGTPRTSAAAGDVSLSKLAGIWKPASGVGRVLIVFADGEIGMGQAGGRNYPLCDGHLGNGSGGRFPITTLACGDWGTTGLSLSLSGSDLRLWVPAGGGAPASSVDWVRVVPPAFRDGSATTIPSWFTGKWAMQGSPAVESFTISGSAAVTWTMETQLGQTLSGTTTLAPIGEGEYVARTTAFGGDAQFWLFAGLGNGDLEVIGGYGLNEFAPASG